MQRFSHLRRTFYILKKFFCGCLRQIFCSIICHICTMILNFLNNIGIISSCAVGKTLDIVMLEYRKFRSIHNRSMSVVYDTIVPTVPWIVARFPWYFRRHCWEKVEHCPRYYGVVIPWHIRCYDNNCQTNPWSVKYPIWLITIAVISRRVYTLNRFSSVMVNLLASSECCIPWDWDRVESN